MRKEACIDVRRPIEVVDVEIPPKEMVFSPQEMEIVSEETRTVYLLLNPQKVPPGSRIAIGCNNPTIVLKPQYELSTPEEYKQEVPKLPISVRGTKEGEEGLVTASFANLKTAVLYVKIVSEEVLRPRNGFAFVPELVTITKGRKRKMRLIADVTIVEPGTLVKVTSSDPSKIRIVGLNMFTVPKPNAGSLLATCYVPVEGLEEGAKSTILAQTRDKEGLNLDAVAEAKVVKPTPPQGLFTDYKLDPKADPRLRFSFDREKGKIHIHTKAPVLKRYFGENAEKLNEDPRAQVLLCETILSCICYEWARFKLNNGIEEALGPMEVEMQRVSRKIEHEYGERIHIWIMGTLPEKGEAGTVETPA